MRVKLSDDEADCIRRLIEHHNLVVTPGTSDRVFSRLSQPEAETMMLCLTEEQARELIDALGSVLCREGVSGDEGGVNEIGLLLDRLIGKLAAQLKW